MLPQGAGDGLAWRVTSRARAVLDAALARHRGARLPWLVPVNRVALRALARDVELSFARDDVARAVAAMELMLRLNPQDNHGYRAYLLTHLLRAGDDAGAAALLARFPGDGMLDMMCGDLLLAFRRQDLAAAGAALQAIGERNPYVLEYLWRAQSKAPHASSAYGITYGSREEAWDYRVVARDVWEATPGALEWLRQAAREPRQKERSAGEVAGKPRRPRSK